MFDKISSAVHRWYYHRLYHSEELHCSDEGGGLLTFDMDPFKALCSLVTFDTSTSRATLRRALESTVIGRFSTII